MKTSLLIFTLGIAVSFALSPIDPVIVAIEPRQNGPTYRLPTSVLPIKYFLQISVDVDNNNFEGNVTINLQITEPTMSIHLNYKDINVAWSDAALILDSSSISFPVISEVDRRDEQIYELHFEQLLGSGRYTLVLQFNGGIRNDLTGLYKSSYVFSNTTLNETRYLASTQLEPTYARSIFPCFDEPAFKATFEVHIYHADKYKALSNMPAIGEPELVPEMKNFYLTRFEETNVAMSTYLLAFVIAEDYEYYTEDPGMLRVYASSHEIHRVKFAQNFGIQALNFYKDFMNLTYQLPKLDMVNIPDFSFGAMENFGLILYRNPYLFRDEDITTIPVRTQQSGALLITHELAHMWFGNEVTPEFWTYIWLSEGFARFFEYYGTDQLIPSWNLIHQFLVTNLQSSFSQDDKISARAMTTVVAEPSFINNMFDYIVYAKSACVIRMFQHVIGMDAFKMALMNYLKDRSFSTTNPDYLFRHLQDSLTGTQLNLPATVKELFETWSNNPGYPVVKVTRNTATKNILFEQSRFLVNPSEAAGRSFPELFIPINFASAATFSFDTTTADFWMSPNSNEQSRTVQGPDNDDWIVVNKQATSYYRVQYDQHNYDLLITALNSGNRMRINVLNRAQLLDDAINLAKARFIDIKIAFEFLNSLRLEVDLPNAYAPWATANNALTYLHGYMKGHEHYEIFLSFVANITSAAYGNVAVNTIETRHLHRIHRLSVAKWACLSGLQACLNDVSEIVNGMLGGSFPIIDEIKDFVYCSASRYSDEMAQALSTHALMLFLEPRQNNLDEIYRLVTGLACSTNEGVIRSYLQLTIAGEQYLQLTQADYIYIFRAIAAGSDQGLTVALEFLSLNFVGVRNRYGSASLASLFEYLGPLMNSQQQISLLEDIVNNFQTLLTSQQNDAAVNAITRARQNIEWIEYHQESISEWLTLNYGKTSGASNVVISIGVWVTALVSVRYLM